MMSKNRFSKKKQGVSVMVGYMLLVVFLIIISAIVYQWIKTYVPRESLECPDGTSLYLSSASFDPSDLKLTITIKNNGRFNVAGYFLHASNSSEQEIPINDLSSCLNESDGPGFVLGSSVSFFEAGTNLFSPSDETTHFFDVPDSVGTPYSIKITPTRFQEDNGKTRFVSCGDASTEILVNILT